MEEVAAGDIIRITFMGVCLIKFNLMGKELVGEEMKTGDHISIVLTSIGRRNELNKYIEDILVKHTYFG